MVLTDTMPTNPTPSMRLEQVFVMLSNRIQTLLQTMIILKGISDPDVIDIFHCARHVLRQIRKDIRHIKNQMNGIRASVHMLKELETNFQQQKKKQLYLEENIPVRFNQHMNIDISVGEDTECNRNVPVPASTTKSANVPKVQYLTLDEFENVPKYMKGRVAYDRVNMFIDLFNNVLSKKYAIYKKKRSSLKKHDADLWSEFKKQETPDVKGLYFCVANDFNALCGTVLDKASQNLMTILRHCGRMREVRTAGLVRYVAMY